MLKNKCDFQHIVQSSLFSKTLSTGKRGKRVCYVVHASIRRQELWNTHQASHIETLDKNHRAIVLVAKAKRKVSCFFYFCQFQWQALACRSRDFKKVFPAKNCFHVCILIANSGSLLTMSFLHCVQEPFFVWKSSEFPLNGNQGPSWHLSKKSFPPRTLWSIPCQNALRSEIHLSKGHEIKLFMSIHVLDRILQNSILQSFNMEVIKRPSPSCRQQRVNHPKCHQCPEAVVMPLFIFQMCFFSIHFITS